MTSKYQALDRLSKLLSYHGICPESLTKIGFNLDLFSEEVRQTYRMFLAEGRRLFFGDAPIEFCEGDNHWNAGDGSCADCRNDLHPEGAGED